MQLEQFFRGMTLTGRTTVQSPANLRLPFRIRNGSVLSIDTNLVLPMVKPVRYVGPCPHL